MIFNTAEEVLSTLIHAYYDKRDIEATLSCVTEDIEWVGTENNETAKGKEALRNLLKVDMATFPDSFGVRIEEPEVQQLGLDVVVFTVIGEQLAIPGSVLGFAIRGTVCCVKTKKGWLIANVHTSVPNSEIEKIALQNELNAEREKQFALLESVPGGVAMYRLKKDGRIETDYVSDGLAKICGYDDGTDFMRVIKDDSRTIVLPEDFQVIAAACKASLEQGIPTSVHYRVYGKDGNPIRITLDSVVMKNAKLGYNDVAVFYAVQTLVNKETTKTLDDLKQMNELVNQVPCGIGIYEIHRDEICLSYLNDAYYEDLGVTRKEREQFLGTNALAVVHPDDHKSILELVKKLKNGRNTADGLIRIKNFKEQWSWYTIKASVAERDHDYLKVYLAYSNCNEMVCSQQEKEEKYEEQIRLRKLGTKNALLVGMFNLTKNNIMELESEYLKIQDSMSNVDEILNKIWDEIKYPSDFPKSREEMLRRYTMGEKRFCVHYYLASTECWTEISFELITNPYNRDVEATGVMRDISESVRSELVVSKLLEIDYDSISTIHIATGIATPFSISSSDRAYGVSADVDSALHENSMTVILEALKSQSIYEWLYSTNAKNEIEYKRVLYAYLDENKKDLICAVQNFTAAYKKEEMQKEKLQVALREAEVANKAKTEFLSRVSHDMRTPLNGILGLTTLLKDSVTDSDTLKDLSELEMSGKYLLNLINDTLDMSRIESGNLELHPVVCDGRTMFNNAIRLGKLSVKNRDIKVDIQVDNILFNLLYVDVSRFEQIVMNVFGNAVKFTPDGGSICMKMTNISVENGIITDKLVISDTGIGMSKEFLPHIFEAFAQEDTSKTNNSQGTGLGMAITKQLLQCMGGDISVKSELGKGTTFTLILKLHMATQEQIKEWKKTRKVSGVSTNLEGRRILLCEDHPLNTQIATRLLEAKGMKVEHAENGQIGIDLFCQSLPHYYDAILMDIRMPVKDGIEATKEIRGMTRVDAKTIPIIAMTANAFADDMEQTREAGMNAHLSKPIETEVLYSTLTEIMEIKKNEDERGHRVWSGEKYESKYEKNI